MKNLKYSLLLILILPTLLFSSSAVLQAADHSAPPLPADLAKLVAHTHAASLKLRQQYLRRTISRDTVWPRNTWGDNLWCLSALYLNRKVDEANARLLKRAQDYIALVTKDKKKAPLTSPGHPGKVPWTFFSLADYVRTLYLFNSRSRQFPGRLKPKTEAAMKQALWLWVKGESRIADAGPNDMFLLLGTENIDLNRRSNYYLVTALLNQDPAYRNRRLDDGHTVAEHAAAYKAYFRRWPGRRAGAGLWIEVGAGYEKYSWPILFNLCDLSPDPVIRHRFDLLLDLAFIEEAQISVRGRRGGGFSRGSYGRNAFESYKNLLYAPAGQPAESPWSRIIATSRYQLPPAAIQLRYRTFPAAKPFVIRNRVLGELAPRQLNDTEGQRIASNSDLVNYAYRTPHYLLGTTLLNPTLDYSGISNQKRACGMLFDNPDSDEICSVHSVIEHGHGGRPQRSFWSVQHKNVLILQRIPSGDRHHRGSYSTGTVGIAFRGKALRKVEKDGWIFATDGKAFVGVKFLDGAYHWDKSGEVATPAHFNPKTDGTRILLQAGDISSDGTFEKFQSRVLASDLKVTADKVDYRWGTAGNHLQVTRYNPRTPDRFTLPQINGKPVNLRPPMAYQSPYLNGKFASEKITVTVGPIHRVLNFLSQGKK